MKCRLLFEKEVMEFHPGTNIRLAPLEYVAQCRREGSRLFAPVGAIIDDPDCFWIVLNGQAEAIDDECKARCMQTADERAATLHAARRLDAGIDPADFELFDKGYIIGYDKSGGYRPGPNWSEFQAKQEKHKEDESEI